MSDIYTSRKLKIPQVDSDPPGAAPEDAWVLHTQSGGGGAGAGEPLGMLMALTNAGSDPITHVYDFSYRTREGTTVRERLT